MNISSILVSIFVAIIICEVVVSLTGMAPQVVHLTQWDYQLSSNPKIGWEILPSDDPKSQFNSVGFRDVEHALDKPDDVFRIVVIGDSIAQGLRVKNLADIFPRIVEEILKEKYQKTEVINLGVSGYNTMQEVETFKEKGIRYQPDLLILQYCLNDTVFSAGRILTFLEDKEQKTEGIDQSVATFWDKSSLVRLLKYRVFSNIEESKKTSRYKLLAKNTVKESLEDLARVTRGENILTLVSVFPRFDKFEPYHWQEDHDYIAELARSQDFMVFDLLETFVECKRQDQRANVDHLHPSVLGHRCAAQALADRAAEL